MSQNNFNPPRRGKPRRIEAGGTRLREDQQQPSNPTNPDSTNPNGNAI